ncbi:MAG TPA: hypothetical protein PLN42_13495, partial [Anaerolineae bacterium]|nr:hypothetical protein [Anaerolineae bacterium]
RLGRRRGDNGVKWGEWCGEALAVCRDLGLPYQIKSSLQPFWPDGVTTDTRPDTPAGSEEK